MSIDLAVRAIKALVNKKVDEVRPYTATVVSVSSGLVQIKVLNATTAGTALYARVMGFQLATNDEVLCINRGKSPIILGKIQRVAPTVFTLESPLDSVTLSTLASISGHVKVTGSTPSGVNTPVGTYPAAGTTPGAITLTGSDVAMIISFSIGTTPASGLMFRINFATSMSGSGYAVFVSAHSTAAATLDTNVTGRSAAGFDVRAATAPTAGSTYIFSILVIDI